MTQESVESGSRRAMAEEEMCRPRPVTTLTSPIARSAPGIRALTRVDFPTPEWPTKTLRWLAQPLAQRVQIGAGKVTSTGTPSGSYCAMSCVGCRQIGLGEAEQRLDAGVVAGNQDAVDHPDTRRRIRERSDDDELVGVGNDRALVRVVVIGRAPQDRLALLDLDDASQCALRAGRVTNDPDPITNDDARSAELPRLGRGHFPIRDQDVGSDRDRR